jgi:uncharacterized membrane protein
VDALSLTEALPVVALAVALAACAGLRAWLPLLLAGALSRVGWLELGESFRFLGSTKALVIFGIATVLELVGDKVPTLDHALDVLGTPLRPAAGALLASSVLGQISDPLAAVVLGTAVGAPAAMVPHAAKSTLRAASTTLTAGIANPVLSLLEDVATVVLFVLAVVLPLVVILMLGIVTYLVARRLTRSRATVKTA